MSVRGEVKWMKAPLRGRLCGQYMRGGKYIQITVYSEYSYLPLYVPPHEVMHSPKDPKSSRICEGFFRVP